MITESNIRKIIILLPVFGVLFTSIILTNFYIYEMKNQYKFEKEQLIDLEKQKIKEHVKEHVDNTIILLENNYKNILDKEKKEIKNTVDIAYKIIEDTYEEYIDFSNEYILEQIKARLKPLRFYKNHSGYYFIFDTEGTNVFHPYYPKLEGVNFNNLKKHDAKVVIKSFLDLVRKKKEGFVSWKWYKPNEKVRKNKIGYLKRFDDLEIFVASAKYEEDILNEAKKELQSLLNIITFDKNGYIFAYDKLGNTISHSKKTLLGKNRWTLNRNGRYLVQEIISKANREEGGYIRYLSTYNPSTQKAGEKISYVKNYDTFNWAIGSGEYTDEIVSSIFKKQKELKNKLDLLIENILVISVLITFFSVFVMLIISNKLKDIFEAYKNRIIEINKSLEKKVKKRTRELENSKEKLKRMALHDPLTDLHNRRYFDTMMKNLLSTSQRSREPLCLILLDIDHFKKVNDTYGHDVGDIVLKELATTLKYMLRESDIIARVGGEEFAIIFPSTNLEGAYKISEKIREKVENLEIKIKEKTPIKFTISIGLSVFDKKVDKTTETIAKRADKALYEAKNSGRNRVVIFN